MPFAKGPLCDECFAPLPHHLREECTVGHGMRACLVCGVMTPNGCPSPEAVKEAEALRQRGRDGT